MLFYTVVVLGHVFDLHKIFYDSTSYKVLFKSIDYIQAFNYFNKISKLENRVCLLENFYSYTLDRDRVRLIYRVKF